MNTEIYIEAAERIDSSLAKYSCLVIWELLGQVPSKEEDSYYELFVDKEDRESRCTFYCIYEKIYGIEPTNEELKEIRVLALLFAAEYFNDENNK